MNSSRTWNGSKPRTRWICWSSTPRARHRDRRTWCCLILRGWMRMQARCWSQRKTNPTALGICSNPVCVRASSSSIKRSGLPTASPNAHVLWYVMENLLSRDLALRERIKGEDYFVFPSQCTAELRFPGVAAFGVAFGFAGPVRSIYATLIAQLAHYEGFKKREFFQDAAAYRAEAGGRCLVRLRDQGRGQGELEVFFDSETPASVRQGFLEFVGKHLEAKSNPGSVTKRHDYHCVNPTCRNPFEDRVVKARLEAGRGICSARFARRRLRSWICWPRQRRRLNRWRRRLTRMPRSAVSA